MAGLADVPTNHGSVAHVTRIVKYSVVCSWLRYRRVTTARAGSSPQLAAPLSQSCRVNASFLKLAVADPPSGPAMHHPRRLHSAKTTRVDHRVCCARAAIGVMGVIDSLRRFECGRRKVKNFKMSSKKIEIIERRPSAKWPQIVASLPLGPHGEPCSQALIKTIISPVASHPPGAEP